MQKTSKYWRGNTELTSRLPSQTPNQETEWGQKRCGFGKMRMIACRQSAGKVRKFAVRPTTTGP